MLGDPVDSVGVGVQRKSSPGVWQLASNYVWAPVRAQMAVDVNPWGGTWRREGEAWGIVQLQIMEEQAW